MTLAYWCVLIALFLPYLSTITAKAVSGGFNPRHNYDPRAFLGSLQGLGRRANNAQLNSFEVTPAFSAAVIIAHLAGGAEQSLIDQLATLDSGTRQLTNSQGVPMLAGFATVPSARWGVVAQQPLEQTVRAVEEVFAATRPPERGASSEQDGALSARQTQARQSLGAGLLNPGYSAEQVGQVAAQERARA